LGNFIKLIFLNFLIEPDMFLVTYTVWLYKFYDDVFLVGSRQIVRVRRTWQPMVKNPHWWRRWDS